MTAFHADVIALAQHARTSPNPDLRAAAQRILTGAHALITETARTEWAEAITYGDGEVRYFDRLDEGEAREHAAHDTRHFAKGSRAASNDIAHAVAVFREVRVLVDGTQITGPWMAPANQFTEGQ